MSHIPKIAIIGAGPAGLTLARLLHLSKATLNVTVYELDSSPLSRPDQGGTLDLHTETGLKAIRKCGLWDQFSKYARYDGEEMIMADKNATILIHKRGRTDVTIPGPSDRPEIDRYRLKEILLDSVPASWVKWGRKLREVTDDGSLRFDGYENLDGPFDLIVGAEGAWSKVRAKLTDVRPYYAGVSGYDITIDTPAKTCPELNKMVGRGSFGSCSDQKFLNAQRLGNDSLKIRSWYLCPEGDAEKDIKDLGKEGTIRKIRSRYPDWAPELTEFLEHVNPETLRPWTLYELPVGTTWDHKAGYTLLGDAASLATPFSGEGVNKAMTDSLELAELIEKSQDTDEQLTLDEAVRQYEEKMYIRAHKIQDITKRNRKAMFAPGTPVTLIPAMIETMTMDNESFLAKVARSRPFLALVHGYFWSRAIIGLAVRKYWRRT